MKKVEKKSKERTRGQARFEKRPPATPFASAGEGPDTFRVQEEGRGRQGLRRKGKDQSRGD